MSAHSRGLLILILVTVLWGTTFALVKGATDTLKPEVLTALRFSLGLIPFIPFMLTKAARGDRTLWRDGLILGLLNFASYMAQAIGLTLIGSNRSAFITGLNVVMVPLLLALLFRRRLPGVVWGAALMALGGIGFISAEGGPLSSGDFWTLFCAFAYALYILYLERSSLHSAMPLVGIQMLVVAVMGWLWSVPGLLDSGWISLFNPKALTPDGGVFIPSSLVWILLYLSLFATAGTTVLMALGQKTVSASEAAIVYALEPVFAALFAWVWIGETLGWRGWIGGAFIVGAMVLSQWPNPKPNVLLSREGDLKARADD